jgi:hypothetical protein
MKRGGEQKIIDLDAETAPAEQLYASEGPALVPDSRTALRTALDGDIGRPRPLGQI